MPHLMPGKALSFLLTDVSRLMRQAFEKAIGALELDLTAGEIRVVSYVVAYDGSRQVALAELMGVEPMTMSAYLDRLETSSFVRRQPDPTDRRAKVVRPTERADELLDRIRPIADEVYRLATNGLSPEAIQTMQGSLAAMRSNLAPA